MTRHTVGFIYSDAAKTVVSSIVEFLEGPYFGFQCFFAERDMIQMNVVFVFDFLENILSQNDKFVVVLGNDFFNSQDTRLDLMSLLYRFNNTRSLCKIVFVLLGDIELPYVRLRAIKENKLAKFITLQEGQQCNLEVAKMIHEGLRDSTMKLTEFPFTKQKFMFGSTSVHNVTACHRDVLPTRRNVVTVHQRSPQSVILDEGIQLSCGGGLHGSFVVERMLLPESLMTSVAETYPPFSPLLSKLNPLYMIRLYQMEPTSGSAVYDITTKCQLWFLRSSSQKCYRILFSDDVILPGHDWSDETEATLLAYNCDTGSFEWNLYKCGVYLLCDVTHSSMDHFEYLKCSLEAMSQYISSNYIKLVAVVTQDRRDVIFLATRISESHHLKDDLNTLTLAWYEQAVIKTPSKPNDPRPILHVTFDIQAGWRRMRVPVNFDLSEGSCYKAVHLSSVCYEAKISCTDADKTLVYGEFLYKMESQLPQSADFTQSLMVEGDYLHNNSYDHASKRGRRMSEEDRQKKLKKLQRIGSTDNHCSLVKSPSTPLKPSPRTTPDSVLMSRELTRPPSTKSCRALCFD